MKPNVQPTKPRPVAALARRPDGSVGLLDEAGAPVPDGQAMVITAGDMTRILIEHASMGMQLGRQSGAEQAAAALPKVYEVGAKAGAEAGVKAGARYVLENTRVHRKVERDAKGQITGTIEERVPISPAPAKQPIGFRK